MKENRLCTADLHLHTNLSKCGDKNTCVASFVPYCEREGLSVIGISNHLYATDTDGINGRTYLEHILQGRREIEELGDCGVKILFGCEAEIFWGHEPGLRRQDEHNFDYVLLSPSHFFNWMNIYGSMDLSNADKVRDLLLKQFTRACREPYGIPVGIAHPLYPIGCPWEQEVVDGITDEQLSECFSLAAETGKSIEIHACLYRNGTKLDEEGLSPSYLRILSAAKKCGCRFHFGTDAHMSPFSFVGAHERLERAAKRIGVTADDLWRPWEK